MTTHPSNHHNNQKLKNFSFFFFFFQKFSTHTPSDDLGIQEQRSDIRTLHRNGRKEEIASATAATVATVWEPCARALFSYNSPLFFCDIVIVIVSRGGAKKGVEGMERETLMRVYMWCRDGIHRVLCRMGKEGYTPPFLLSSSSLLLPRKKGLEEVKMGFFSSSGRGKGEE